MLSLSDNKRADVIDAINSTTRYLVDVLDIDNPYIDKWKIIYIQQNFSHVK